MSKYAIIPEDKKIEFIKDRLCDLNREQVVILSLGVFLLFFGIFVMSEKEGSIFVVQSLIAIFFVSKQMPMNKNTIDIAVNVIQNEPIKINTPMLRRSCIDHSISTFEQSNSEHNVTNPLHDETNDV